MFTSNIIVHSLISVFMSILCSMMIRYGSICLRYLRSDIKVEDIEKSLRQRRDVWQFVVGIFPFKEWQKFNPNRFTSLLIMIILSAWLLLYGTPVFLYFSFEGYVNGNIGDTILNVALLILFYLLIYDSWVFGDKFM